VIEIEKPVIECLDLSEDNTYGKFVVEPLKEVTVQHWAIA
jgi:DNA-directed RNA polymerase subunit alpha